MSARGTILIDDSDIGSVSANSPFGYFGTSPYLSTQLQWNLSLYTPDPAVPPADNSWTFNVEGYSVALYGITPPTSALFNQTIKVSDSTAGGTDDTKLSTFTSYTYPSPATAGAFYASANASAPGPIALAISGYRGMVFDYLLVDVGEFTDITGRTMFVDDADSEISWNGSWQLKSDYNITAPCFLPAFPLNSTADGTNFNISVQVHHNSTHASGNVGDSFEFQFAGTSIGVYGVSPGPLSDDWQLQLSFSIDGGSNTTRTFTASSENSLIGPFFNYFNATSLSAGNHTLVGTVATVTAGSVRPQAQIDFITYLPTFTTLHDRPNFGTSSSSTSPPGGAQTVASSSHKSNAGAIAGGVVGGLLLLLGLAAIFFLLQRRRARTRDTTPATYPNPAVAPATTPHTHMREASNGATAASTFSASLPGSHARTQSYGDTFGAGTPSIIGSDQSPPPPPPFPAGAVPLAPNRRNEKASFHAARDPMYTTNPNPHARQASQTQTDVSSEASGVTAAMEERVRQLQAEMDSMRREFQYQGSLPPGYEAPD